ncbi:MAG: tripartite tricarboxylate transporter TctB family protein [Desulfobacteraceae bacterium]|nr:tripartite tricarboxylate transporter TctB family protein [Desulfobacteraceae bacterium]
MKNEERIFLFFLLFVAVVMTLMSLRFSSSSRLLPMLSGLFVAIMLVFLLATLYAPNIADWYQRFEGRTIMKTDSLTAAERKREIAVTGWFIGAFLLIYMLGFMVAIPVFLFLFFRLYADYDSWFITIVTPGIVTLVVYIAFITVLRVPLYRGMLFELIL